MSEPIQAASRGTSTGSTLERVGGAERIQLELPAEDRDVLDEIGGIQVVPGVAPRDRSDRNPRVTPRNER